MKKLVFTILVLMFGLSFCYAKSFVIVDKTSNNVISLSPEDDAQLKPEWEKFILEDNFFDLIKQFEPSPTYYIYKNNKFIKNVKKISDEENAKQTAIEKLDRRKENKKNALDKIKLIANLTDDELSALE